MSRTNDENLYIKLNPFAFPTETDGRFLLLLLAVAGVTFNLGRWLMFTYTNVNSDLLIMVISIGLVLAIFLWAWQRAKRAAQVAITKRQWTRLTTSEVLPPEQEHFRVMQVNMQEMITMLPEISANPPELLWDGQDLAPTGVAFGYGTQQHVLVRRGLFEKFVIRKFEEFQAVLMHELSHIANQDVSKTTFALQLGYCFNRVAVVAIILLNLALIFGINRYLNGNGAFSSIWDGIKLFTETNIKLLLLMIMVDIIRSSVLRVREYYADSRATIWLGDSRPLVELLQRESNKETTEKADLWGRIQQFYRKKLAPLHPTSAQRVAILHDPRGLFQPQVVTAISSGFLVGLALNSNIAVAITIFGELITLMHVLDTAALNSPNLFLGFVLFFIGFIPILIGIVVITIFMVIFGLMPITATTGIAIQKAVFVDNFVSAPLSLFSKREMVRQILLLCVGMIFGFLLSPIPGALTIGSIAIGGNAIVLLPGYLVGWILVLLIWMIPIQNWARQVYSAHHSSDLPTKKRKWLTRISTILLLPGFGAMVWTQIILSSLIGFRSEFSDPAYWEVGFIFIVLAWLLALPIYGVIRVIGRRLLEKKGWLTTESAQETIPTWASLPAPYRFPKPTPVSFAGEVAPPPL